jgi:hypothetical protein
MQGTGFDKLSQRNSGRSGSEIPIAEPVEAVETVEAVEAIDTNGISNIKERINKMDEQDRKLAGLILNCKPEDLKGVSLRADGSLAVVAPNGMKFIFSPVELENARDSFGLPPVNATPAQQTIPLATNASPTTSTRPATGKNRRQESRL